MVLNKNLFLKFSVQSEFAQFHYYGHGRPVRNKFQHRSLQFRENIFIFD